MSPSELREHARMGLQAIEAEITRLTATGAKDQAPLVGIFEMLRDWYRAVLVAFDQDAPARAGALLDQVDALNRRLRQTRWRA